MKKVISLIMSVTMMALSISCEQDIDSISNEKDEIYEVGFKIKVKPVTYTMTKAENINADEMDDFIDRLDMYEYNKAGELLRHESWQNADGLDLSAINPVSYDVYGTRHNLVFVANLDEDSAKYLEGLNADEIGEMPTGIIPLEAGNFRAHKPIMCGCTYAYFDKNKTRAVTLYRYLTRIEISSITAAFDDEALFDKDVKLKKIAIINYPNALRLLDESANSIVGVDQDVLGTGFTIVIGEPAFGNIKTVENACNNWELNSSYFDISNGEGILDLGEYGGEGKLSQRYNYILNNNRLAPKGQLIIDANGYQHTASVHEFGESEGWLCSSTDASISHIVDVNKVFYTIPVKRQVTTTLYGEVEYQDDVQKLVIEAVIDGTSYFYIISMKDLVAGMIYKIGNINLKSIGSEYSNKYEKLADPPVAASVGVSGVNSWDETVLPDMNVGYTVDGFDIYGYE